jgi:hypothetical protein
MTLEELSFELKKLVGETVYSKLIAFNIIILYFFGEPRSSNAVTVSIASTWRYEQHGEIVVGSEDFPAKESDFTSKEEYRKTFERMCALTDVLEGAMLVDCEVDLVTSDICLTFSEGQVIRNFANKAFADAAWTYRNPARNLTAHVSPSGVSVMTAEEE